MAMLRVGFAVGFLDFGFLGVARAVCFFCGGFGVWVYCGSCRCGDLA